jgi:hypothetical protein
MTSLIRRNIAAAALLILGLTQMSGYVCGSRLMRGLGAATAVAPFPKVFCDMSGLEGFASTFTVIGKTQSGRAFETRITPELYTGLRGSYNRRNAYGAALSFAPRLPDAMWQSVANYALRANGPLRKELGLPKDSEELRIRIATQTRGRDDVWEMEVPLQ